MSSLVAQISQMEHKTQWTQYWRGKKFSIHLSVTIGEVHVLSLVIIIVYMYYKGTIPTREAPTTDLPCAPW